MHMLPYSSALGTEVDNEHYGQQLPGVFGKHSTIEEQLSGLYQQALNDF